MSFVYTHLPFKKQTKKTPTKNALEKLKGKPSPFIQLPDGGNYERMTHQRALLTAQRFITNDILGANHC